MPVNGLNEKTRYENKVVGNSPEFMPLDNSLNRDIQNCHDYHCILTNHLHRDDFRRFSKATPNLIDRGVRRIWDDEVGCPGSARILADIEKATNAMMMVMLEKGKMVPKLVNRNGHRNEKGGRSKRGGNNSIGCQQRKKEQWCHPMIRDAVAARKSMIVEKYTNVNSASSEEGSSEESDVSVTSSDQ